MMRKETRRMIDVSSSVWHVTRRMSVMTRLPAFLVLLVGLSLTCYEVAIPLLRFLSLEMFFLCT
jgi:hypothetical protein